MSPNSRKLTQKVIAMILIVAILDVVGVSPAIIFFCFATGFFVWLVIQRSRRQQSRDIFEFYLAAEEILRDQDRHWYGFEIAEVLERGDQVWCSMPDPPPLANFALGALHHRLGDYELAVEYLSDLVEERLVEEHLRSQPSPQLRRYVGTLRSIERDPALAPQMLAAVRSLERMRRRASALLDESRERLQQGSVTAAQSATGNTARVMDGPAGAASELPFHPAAAQRPITDVLRDVYQEEKKTA